MSELDPRWVVPDEYSFDRLDGARPLIESQRFPDWPELQLVAMKRLSARLDRGGTTAVDLAAWQLASGHRFVAVETAEAVLAGAASPEEKLLAGHVVALGGEDLEPPIYRVLWHGDIGPDHPLRFELAVSIAGSIVVEDADDALSFLREVAALRERADPVAGAMFDLLTGVATSRTDAEASRLAIVRAHDSFHAVNDNVGLAQCALAEFQRERAGEHRNDRMRGYLEYAVHQYVVSCRSAWAARTITYALLSHLIDEMQVDRAEVAAWLNQAIVHAEDGVSFAEVARVLRFASRFDYKAEVVDGSWSFTP